MHAGIEILQSPDKPAKPRLVNFIYLDGRWMTMTFRLANMCAILLFFLLVSVSYTSAAPPIATISQGNTIFIGEQGLDITRALGSSTQIGWWASAADIATSSPNQVVPISSPTSFYVDPTSFGSYTGGWYRLDSASK